MRILGIDYGDKKIGLALSDPLLLTAQPLQSYRRRRKQEDTRFFQSLVSRYQIKKIVVGLPLLQEGTPGTRAQKTKKFARWLEKTVNIPVILWDERFTTKEALEILRTQKASIQEKKDRKDKLSAALILSSYLENKRTNPHVAQDS